MTLKFIQRKYVPLYFQTNFCAVLFIRFLFLFQAEAEMAYELQAAKTKQRIKEEQMQIKVVERTQEIAVQLQEVQRREQELEATIRQCVFFYYRYNVNCLGIYE